MLHRMRAQILAVTLTMAACTASTGTTTPSRPDDLRTCRPAMSTVALHAEARKRDEAADRHDARAHELASGAPTSRCVDQRITDQSTSGTERLTPQPTCWSTSETETVEQRRRAEELRAEADECRQTARTKAAHR